MKRSLLLAVILTVNALSMTVVENGVGKAVIVVSDAVFSVTNSYQPARGQIGTPEIRIKFAAEEIQRYIEKMSGTKLAIVSDKEDVKGPKILVGRSRYVGEIKDLPTGVTAERNEEGFVIECKKDTITIIGNDNEPYFGTYYAAVEFLNRLGVRWFMPSDFGEVVPQMKTIVYPEGRVVERPSFRVRMWWCNQSKEMGEQEALWKLRNKMQIKMDAIIGMPGDSWLRQYMPDIALTNSKPELFARNPNGTINPYMPNLTNPEAAKMVAEKVIAKVKAEAEKGNNIEFLGFAPDDGLPMDHTPQTLKEWHQGFTDWVGRDGIIAEHSISEEWFMFMNRVAEEVAKVYPNLILTSNGYANRALPPENVVLHPNMGIMVAQIWADNLKPFNHPKSWQSQVQFAELKRWTEINKRVFLYEYNHIMLVTLLTAVPQTKRLLINYPMLKSIGVIGFSNESIQPYMEEGIASRYMRAKLMWHADMEEGEAILNDYYEKWYGPAKEFAQLFWNTIEDCVIETPLLGHEDRILPYVYNDLLLQKLEELCAKEEKAADSEPYKTHVKIDRLTLELMKEYMAVHQNEFDGKYGLAAQHIEKMMSIRAEMGAISPFLAQPPSKTGIERYYGGDFYWGMLDRLVFYKKVESMISGETGRLLVMATKKVKYCLDEGGLGKSLRWFASDFDRSQWMEIDTTIPFYLQVPGAYTSNGIPYIGRMWYVFELNVPQIESGQKIRLFAPMVITEAWVWMNDQYVGHREYREAYVRPQEIDFDVTQFIKPGKKNTIAIWVHTGMCRTQVAEGFQGRLFLYAVK